MAAPLAMAIGDGLFLGFDSSTQSLKATVVDSSLRVFTSTSVTFDADLPHYGTSGGVHFGRPIGGSNNSSSSSLHSSHSETSLAADADTAKDGSNGGRVTAPVRMWVEAMDKILSKLQAQSFPFDRVKAVSGSGQQHGTVYWRNGARQRLRSLQPLVPLHSQLTDANAFAVADSPIWMDSSTTQQCRALEAALGGPLALAALTGSRAYERYSGPQIRRLAELAPEAYAETERISLVSSFAASLLLGDYAGIDATDGAGMNLLDLRSRQWSAAALEATAAGLAAKLGEVVAPHAVLGPIHPFYVQRYSFDPQCMVAAWSGDNPCSLAGLALGKTGDVAISMGTSDTVFTVVSEATPGLEGHVFPNPIDPDHSFMTMLVYKNASLTRQEIRDRCAGGSWEEFERLLNQTPPLNNGHIGFYYSQPEILPPLPAGTHRFRVVEASGSSSSSNNSSSNILHGIERVDSFDRATEVRAIVEGQLASMRGHAERMGLKSPPKRIIATGGASANRAILRVIADVFGCPVFTAPSTDSASCGAALRAMHAYACHTSGRFVPFADVLAQQQSSGSDGGGSGAAAATVTSLTEAAAAGSAEIWEKYGVLVRQRMALEAKMVEELGGQ